MRPFWICYLSVVILDGVSPDTGWLKGKLDYYMHNPVQPPVLIQTRSRTEAIGAAVEGARQFIQARAMHPPSFTPDKQFYLGVYEWAGGYDCVAIVEANREGKILWRKHPLPVMEFASKAALRWLQKMS